MTRVLMVVDGLGNGGAERQMVLLAASLPESWLTAVLSMEDGPYRPYLEGLGITVHICPRRNRFDVTVALRMWRVAHRWAPDVVHSWGWMSSVAMVPYCRSRQVPLVNGTIRRGCLPPRRAAMERLGLRLADVVVANSRAGLEAYGYVGAAHGRVIYNGFDAHRSEIAANATRDLPPHEGTVAVMTARMHPAKDWRSFIRAARELNREVPSIRFVAVGSGPSRDLLMTEADDLVDAGTIEFIDGGLEVLSVVAAADIGVLLTNSPAYAEGCSNSIMEYLACGLPVICTHSGGNPELVEDEVTGLLVPPGDQEALASALRTLRDDTVRRREMGREGRRRLLSRLTVEEMTAGFVAAYRLALDIRNRTRV